MDHKTFDELVAKLTSAPSRRDAVKSLIGGALAAAGASADALAKGGKGKKADGGKSKGRGKGNGGKGGGAGAEKHKNKHGRKKKCGRNEKRCGGNCRNITNSAGHCGGCNNKCLPGQICRNATCVSAT